MSDNERNLEPRLTAEELFDRFFVRVKEEETSRASVRDTEPLSPSSTENLEASVNGESDEEEEEEEDTWEKEAASLPLVPAQLRQGVPTFWDIELNSMLISREPFKIFMNQIKQTHGSRMPLLIELDYGGETCFYSHISCYGGSNAGRGRLLQGNQFCATAGYSTASMVRMHYRGYRELSSGEKVYCFRTQNMSATQNMSTQNTSARKRGYGKRGYGKRGYGKRKTRARKEHRGEEEEEEKDVEVLNEPRKRKPPSWQEEYAIVPPEKKGWPARALEEEARPKGASKLQPGVERVTEQVVSPPPPPPPPQQQQQQRQEQKPEENEQHYGQIHPQNQQQTHAQLQPQQQPNKRQRQQNKPTTASVDWVSFVAGCLRSRADLDRALVDKYLLKFCSLSAEDRENHGKVILQLAADTSVTALKTLLEGAVC